MGASTANKDEIRAALQKAINSRDLPSHPIKNVHARLMSALWRMAADDFAELNPTAWDEAQLDEPTKNGAVLLTLVSEVHTWAEHGCRAIDFIFPTFFGAKLPMYHRNEDDDFVPVEDEE